MAEEFSADPHATATQDIKPFVSARSKLPEFTAKALILGLLMAGVLALANAYVGLKAGMTISAVFPAAVTAMAVFRMPILKGNILEENLARTTASVGEALVAGAIFTIPAFLLTEVDGKLLWGSFQYWPTSILVLAGGLLGVLFIILLRRTLTVDMPLPYPEGFACYEMVISGQKGQTGARYVFGAMGIGALFKLFLDSGGIAIFKESITKVLTFPKAMINHFYVTDKPISMAHGGGMSIATPLASPALMGVGYLIGMRYATINFSGSVLAWLFLIPLIIFLDPELPTKLGMDPSNVDWDTVSFSVWYNIVRPIAVGAMLMGSVHTLYKMRASIFSGVQRLAGQRGKSKKSANESRLEKDLEGKWIVWLTIASFLLVFVIYYYFIGGLFGTLVASIVMIMTSFLFAAVGAYLVGIVGNSNQPVSGLTLSGLIIAALMMLLIGVTGAAGVAAALGTATVVCCAACMSGDMIQDLKVGQLLGGTPWKMEVAEVIAVVFTSFVVIVPAMYLLHNGTPGGIGGENLPAPQAGLMAMLAKGILSGQMAWMLVFTGIAFAIMLIMIGAPSPMIVAVGMYLPFETTAAIFIGGVMRYLVDRQVEKKKLNKTKTKQVVNIGILVASGFIAGEAILGVLIASLVSQGKTASIWQLLSGNAIPEVHHSAGAWLSLIVFAVVGYALIKLPLRAAQKDN